MKTFIKLISVFLIAGLVFSSCEKDYLDVNKDPNNPSEAPANRVFPASTAEVAGVVGGRYTLVGGIFSQWWTQANSANQYKEFAAFDLTSSNFDFAFQELYSGALNDLQDVRVKAKNKEDWSFYLMATVMEAYTYQILVDLYDKIPYREALQGADNIDPQYDNGQLVYDSLITKIDRALAKPLDASTVTDPGATDLVFGGDMDQWVRFANTLKLKIYLRQSDARPEIAENGINELYNSGAEFLTQSATMDVFIDQDSKSNPFYEMDRRQLNTRNNLRASKTLFDYLQTNGDPRYEELYMEAENGGYNPMKQGNHNASNSQLNPADVSVVTVEPNDPVYFLSAAESHFMQAEVAVKYGLGDAQTHYQAGVKEAFNMHGLDGTPFVGSGGAYEFPVNGNEEEKMKAIMKQKWVGFARFQGIEAWIEWKRTGYPEVNENGYNAGDYEPGQFVSPVSNTLGENQFPLRLPFPQSEYNNNPNTPDLVDITQPVWWDQK